MKIDVIIPTNNIEEINGFIESFNTMKKFKRYCKLVVIGNGEVVAQSIKNTSGVRFIRDNNDYSNKVIPFSRLRGLGMVTSKSNFFLFMDDDNRFPKGSDEFFEKCMDFLIIKSDCCTLQADRKRKGKRRTRFQENGFFWTGYGLFIKNVIEDYSELLYFKGCCEEVLFAYEALNIFGNPYICYGNPTTRDKSQQDNWKQNNDSSYSEVTIQNNIQGFIQKKYKDQSWSHYKELPNTPFPNLLKEKIKLRN